MSSGTTTIAVCPARAAIAGNPSDGYGGAVLSVTVDDLLASAAGRPHDRFEVDARDPDLARLLDATAAEFELTTGRLPDLHLSASTTIPRSVGLAGSSALIVAALRVLASETHRSWTPLELARIVLRVERERLEIAGGMQDPVVQAANRPVLMEFSTDGAVAVSSVDLHADLVLFVAWDPAYSESSDVAHRALRRRAELPENRRLLEQLAELARGAAVAAERGDVATLATAIDETFDLRRELTEIDPRQVELVEIGRRAGAATNSAGSGGSVIGLARTVGDLPAIRTAYDDAGCELIEIY